METKVFSPCFFLGANTANGFYPLTKELLRQGDDIRLYLIKGGPGTGKSTLMKAVCRRAQQEEIEFERIYCSSDPDSLDGVYLPSLHAAVLDATPPHPFELKFPGIRGRLVDMGQCWNTDLLEKNAGEILRLTRANSEAHGACQRFLSAAGRLQTERMQLALPDTDLLRVIRHAKRICARVLPERETKSVVTRRFLSACTPKGEVFFYETLCGLCEQIVAVEDDIGAVSAAFMQTVLHEAVDRGLSVIACPCILRPDGIPEHILIPKLKLGFVTSNAYHIAPDAAEKTVSASRFTDAQAAKAHKNRFSFYRKAQAELLDGAIEKLEQAKALHDRLEAHYIAAMDFGKTEKIKLDLLEELFENIE